MSAAQWIASPSGTVMRGYSQSWAIADLSGDDCSANLIAGVFSDGKGGEEAAERHARLIVTAPEMFEALATLYHRTIVGTDEQRHAALDEAWRVLVKAKATTAIEPNSVGTPQGVNQND